MKTAIGPEQLAFLAGLRRYLDGLDPGLIAATRAENTEDPMQPREHGRRFLRQLGADGWLGISWPREYGGQGRTRDRAVAVLRGAVQPARCPTGC